MKIEEITIIKITFPKPKARDEHIWNLETNHVLREAIEECLATGKTVRKNADGNMVMYEVQPKFPLTESAME